MKSYFTILPTNTNRKRFIVGLQTGADKTFEITDIAKLHKDYPQKGNMNDKQYKVAVNTFVQSFMEGLEQYEFKVSHMYSTFGEFSFADYTTARFCIRELKKLLEAE